MIGERVRQNVNNIAFDVKQQAPIRSHAKMEKSEFLNVARWKHTNSDNIYCMIRYNQSIIADSTDCGPIMFRTFLFFTRFMWPTRRFCFIGNFEDQGPPDSIDPSTFFGAINMGIVD